MKLISATFGWYVDILDQFYGTLSWHDRLRRRVEPSASDDTSKTVVFLHIAHT